MKQADSIEQSPEQTQQFVALPPNAFYPQQQNDEIDLAELWNALWQGKIIIIAISIVFAIFSIFYAKSLPDVYKASAVLSSAQQETGTAGLSGLGGQFGGLASMAGIRLGGGKIDKTGFALEVLKSRAFIERFISKHDLKVPLLAATGWNPATDTLIINEEVYDTKQNKWIRKASYPKSPVPSDWQAYLALSKLISIVQDKETGMVTIEIEYFEPAKAKAWLTALITDINQYVREKDEKEAKDSIEYLTAKLHETNISNMENVFYQLIEEQTKNMMLTQVKAEYVLETLDPPQVPEQKAKPKRALIVALGTMLGGMLSVLIVLVRYFVSKPNAKRSIDSAQVSEERT